MPGVLALANTGDKANKLARSLSKVRNLDDLYMILVSKCTDSAALVKFFDDKASDSGFTEVIVLNDQLPTQGVDQSQHGIMCKDGMSYLTDDIHCEVDRAAMSVSLVTRMPFLDLRIAETA